MTWDNETHIFRLLQMNRNSIVFQTPGVDSYLILLQPDFQKEKKIYSITQINSHVCDFIISLYILSQLCCAPTPSGSGTDTIASTPEDDKFSEYEGFTEEEIIYDYLQRREEEQDEEDYYLEMMDDE